MDEQKSRQTTPVSQPESEKGDGLSRIERSDWKAPGKAMTAEAR
jgi:hypothetical protein